MSRIITALFALLLCLAPVSAASAQATRNGWQNDPAVERRVEDLLRQMTLEEKVGQLNQYSYGMPTGPGTGRSNVEEAVRRGEVGSFLNVTDPALSNRLQRVAMQESRLKIPIIFGLDVIHGYRTVFPVPLAMSATWDADLVERASRMAAREATASGIRWTFSPMVDIARDARWGRIVEGAGEDPYLGSVMARAYVRGYQGATLNDPHSMAACVKHYVAYGAAEAGRDYNTVDMSERQLREVYLPPFRAAVDEGAATLMAAFNTVNGVPASANEFTLTQVLRREWNFRGFVVSDWGSVGELMNHGVANDLATATRKGFLAGIDMDMESNAYFQHLAAAVRAGDVTQSALDEAVRRVLRVKLALGLFERPYVDEKQAVTTLPAANLALAREAAERSFVLLKNDAAGGSPVLPIRAGVRTVALIGPLADSRPDMLGTWSAQGKAEEVVTLRAALEARARRDNFRLLYAKGTEIRGTSDAGFAEAVSAAQQADVVLVALGEDASWMTGEAASRAFIELPGNQQQLLERVAAAGKPTALVLFSGRPLALTAAARHAPAILEAWSPGVQAGPALERVLFGEASPAGRLTVTFPRSLGQVPIYHSVLNTGRPPVGLDLTQFPTSTDQKYRSRYVDEQNAPLYPFGFGLTYTTFDYSAPQASNTELSAAAVNSGQAQLRVSAEVRNTGARAGEEVVQLYIGLRGTSVARPVRELRGFRRVALGPGEARRVEFTLGREELSFLNGAMRQAVEPAELTVWVAPNAQAGTPVKVTLR
ncbi:MAG TPA: glycoside hydrolase family 3 N-terminal domain-containing protein [Pyrinomonadaceae bacterium]|nr:glycoside hydrolase family 3 N-terminal domain-containing protein [Pyrinomonadaceae bacterium]